MRGGGVVIQLHANVVAGLGELVFAIGRKLHAGLLGAQLVFGDDVVLRG